MAVTTKYRPYAGQHKARALWQDMMNDAANGDENCRRIVADRLFPKLKPIESPKEFVLEGTSPTEKANSILTAVSTGQLTIDEGVKLIGAIAALMKVTEIDDLQQRIEQLESNNG